MGYEEGQQLYLVQGRTMPILDQADWIIGKKWLFQAKRKSTDYCNEDPTQQTILWNDCCISFIRGVVDNNRVANKLSRIGKKRQSILELDIITLTETSSGDKQLLKFMTLMKRLIIPSGKKLQKRLELQVKLRLDPGVDMEKAKTEIAVRIKGERKKARKNQSDFGQVLSQLFMSMSIFFYRLM